MAELLKYTSSDHQDYAEIKAALAIMRQFAKIINEKKKAEDNLQKIFQWQSTIHNWQVSEMGIFPDNPDDVSTGIENNKD